MTDDDDFPTIKLGKGGKLYASLAGQIAGYL